MKKRNRKKTSIIWTMPKEDFSNLVKNSNSISSILSHFGFSVTGGGHKKIKQRCIEENIDISHIQLGRFCNMGRSFSKREIPLEAVMIENSYYNTRCLKKRLIRDGLIENKCCICGCLPEWNGSKLVFILDHINGDHNDNRRENLRLLCPNCNSQTLTFCRGKKIKKISYCPVCGGEKKNNKIMTCSSQCASKLPSRVEVFSKIRNKGKVNWDSVDLKDLMICKKLPLTQIGKMFGVSDNCIRKRAKKIGLI